MIGGPDRDRTDDLFHAMEARSQLRHRPTKGGNILYSAGACLIRQTLRTGQPPLHRCHREKECSDPRTPPNSLFHPGFRQLALRRFGPDAQPLSAAAPPAPAGFAIATCAPRWPMCRTADRQPQYRSLEGFHRDPRRRSAGRRLDAARPQRTLPGLIDPGRGALGAGALSPAFAVFRNLDALYDVLLRVTETAALAGSASDAASLEDARAGLEDGRANSAPGCSSR